MHIMNSFRKNIGHLWHLRLYFFVLFRLGCWSWACTHRVGLEFQFWISSDSLWIQEMSHVISLEGYFLFLIFSKMLRHHQPVERVIAFTLRIETIFELAQYLNCVLCFFISSIGVHHMQRVVKWLVKMVRVAHCIKIFACSTPQVTKMHGSKKCYKYGYLSLIFIYPPLSW